MTDILVKRPLLMHNSNMVVIIQKTDRADEAYEIAKKLPDYFNTDGLKKIRTATFKENLFGAFAEDKMIGFATYKELNPEATEITWLGVLPDFQGNGIGKQLVSESLKEMSRIYQICEVKTLSEMHPDLGYAKTRKFYISLGFIPLETIHPYPGWGDANPCQIFVKCLQP